MKTQLGKVTAGSLRWLFKSVPGVAVLLIATGAGVAYAAKGGEECDPAKAGPRGDVMFSAPAIPGGGALGELSEADRKSLRDFGACMHDAIPQPGAEPPDPEEGKEAMDSAFDSCKAKLSDSLRERFEKTHAEAEAYRECLQANGAPEPRFHTERLDEGENPREMPAPPEPPSEADRKAMEKAAKACEDKAPEGAHGGTMRFHGVGGPGGHGPGGPPGPPPFARPEA
jgi:hypothetical protein